MLGDWCGSVFGCCNGFSGIDPVSANLAKAANVKHKDDSAASVCATSSHRDAGGVCSKLLFIRVLSVFRTL